MVTDSITKGRSPARSWTCWRPCCGASTTPHTGACFPSYERIAEKADCAAERAFKRFDRRLRSMSASVLCARQRRCAKGRARAGRAPLSLRQFARSSPNQTESSCCCDRRPHLVHDNVEPRTGFSTRAGSPDPAKGRGLLLVTHPDGGVSITALLVSPRRHQIRLARRGGARLKGGCGRLDFSHAACEAPEEPE